MPLTAATRRSGPATLREQVSVGSKPYPRNPAADHAIFLVGVCGSATHSIRGPCESRKAEQCNCLLVRGAACRQLEGRRSPPLVMVPRLTPRRR